MNREVFTTLDAEGAYGQEHDDVESAREEARPGPGAPTCAVVRRIYTYDCEEMVDWPEGARQWPPNETAQENAGQCFAR